MKLKEVVRRAIRKALSDLGRGHPVFDTVSTVHQNDLNTNKITSAEINAETKEFEPAKFEYKPWGKSNLIVSSTHGPTHNVVLDLDCPHSYRVDADGTPYVTFHKMTDKQQDALQGALSLLGLSDLEVTKVK